MKCAWITGGIVIATCLSLMAEGSFRLDWAGVPDQTWTGSQIWANRLQDWRVADGRVESVPNRNLPQRTLHLLSHDLASTGNSFTLSVELGRIESDSSTVPDGAAGFLLGAGNGKMDYRGASLVHQTPGPGAGIFAGIDHDGRVFIHDNELGVYGYGEADPIAIGNQHADFDASAIKLICSAREETDGSWMLDVQAKSADGKLIGRVSGKVPASRLVGNVGLVADPGQQQKSLAHWWFDNWQGTGDRLAFHGDRSFGPVVGTHYTVSRRILKVNAQMAPLPESRLKGATLEIQEDGKWTTIATADIDPVSYTALFRVVGWDDARKVDYRVTAPNSIAGETPWRGTIQLNPRGKQEFAVAAFTGNHNISRTIAAGNKHKKGHKGNWIEGTWFPHADLVANVVGQSPDLLFFSGDQVYESASPSFADTAAIELDYLYKWYLYMWAFRDLTCAIPTVCIPDDHDVYQGNVWGQNGRAARNQNDGGYVHPAGFIKLVERTQTANLPDPYDPTPIEQGIGVYYTALNWGPMSFAVIEDRKFKTGPKSEEALSGDESKLVLLGDRQIAFIEDWVGDWSDGAAMKAALTATIFGQLHTWREKDGSIEQDRDTNGWPVEGRNQALRSLRKGFTLMIGGDQHLATTVHHGVDEFRDSGWSICIPSIANYFPRSWIPIDAGLNREQGQGAEMGDHFDSWGNKVTMYAVANPGKNGIHEPKALHDRMPGYGIIRFNQNTRTIRMENWPRYATLGNGEPYPGWPITVSQQSNYGRTPTAWLPELVIGMENPVVQVFEKKSGELVYALRICGNRFQPGVFSDGEYVLKVGDPDADRWETRVFKASNSKDVPAVELP
jgi:alkaline phosphatase D